ncbi:hypothetical protein BDZ97DRAFT_1783865 [Flammula alnicola]|nr:hypothetical protein BDZ97DRAFT_1783865 [Flammula alnicola]
MPKKHSKATSTKRAAANPVPNEEAMKKLMEFALNDAKNPPKVSDLFKIPDGLSSEWQQIFDKVAAYYEKQCAASRNNLITLEKRSWLMKDEKLSEFEMLTSSTEMKHQGNEEFKKGNLFQAQILYGSAISTFPTPDVMNNMAACCLKLNQFQIAEDFTTKALDMDLFSNPSSIAKARFRRASARLYLAKFVDALEDAIAAQALSPTDASINDLLARIQELIDAVKTPEEILRYLKKQPKAAPRTSFTGALDMIQDSNMGYMRIPDFIERDLKTKTLPPTF